MTAWDFDTIIAGSGKEGLETAKKHQGGRNFAGHYAS